MTLPFADRAFIAPEKLHDYLLSPIHPTGAAKAAAFTSVGYSHTEWRVLQHDLMGLAQSADAVILRRSAHGQKFVVRGILHGPSGRPLSVTTVWIVRDGEQFPRFVTAYPRRSV